MGLIIASALALNYRIASENIPGIVSDGLADLDVSPFAFLLAVNLLFLALGCLFDATTLLMIVVPLFVPAATQLGIELAHFGVVIVVNIMIGLVTPPYGVVLFVINGVTSIPLRDIISEIIPFIGVLLFALLLMILFPSTVLWLPRLFGYQG